MKQPCRANVIHLGSRQLHGNRDLHGQLGDPDRMTLRISVRRFKVLREDFDDADIGIFEILQSSSVLLIEGPDGNARQE